MTPLRNSRFGTVARAFGQALALAPLLAMASTSLPVRAADADPLHSDDCLRAIASMQVEERAEANRHAGDATAHAALPTPSPALQDARRDAARHCLASRLDVDPPRGRFAQAPISVRPVGSIAAQPSSHALAPIVVHAAPSSPQRPDAVVSCDAGGCWANDGSRLQRVGPVLWGTARRLHDARRVAALPVAGHVGRRPVRS